MKNAKFYICPHCGNIAQMIHDAGVSLVCCGRKMEEMIPNSVEASGEKHMPVVSREGDKLIVNVGSVSHPMEEKHSIEWVHVETENGSHIRRLQPGSEPTVEFSLNGEKPVAVYAYCNLHGLWKLEM